jgi:hypothetical protein
MIAIGITKTAIFVRLTRGQTMSVKVEDLSGGARRSIWSATACATRLIQGRGESLKNPMIVGPFLPSPGGGGSARMSGAKCETGWGDFSTRAPFETRDCHPTPPLISFASTLPLQGRVKTKCTLNRFKSPPRAARAGNPSQIRDRPPGAARNARSGRNAWHRGGPALPT